MDYISPVGATPRKVGWSCQVELLLVGETLAALIKVAYCASSAMARVHDIASARQLITW
jgi:hypothetical protein